MTPPTLPDNWRSILAGYVLNDLTTEEADQVQQWLAQYPIVAEELAALDASWHSLPEGLPPQSPPPHLRDRILTTIQARESDQVAAPPAAPQLDPWPTPTPPLPRRSALRPRSRRPWVIAGLGLGWAATAIALVSTSVENQRLRQALQRNEIVLASAGQPNTRVYTLAGSETQPQANGRLVVNPASATALILTQDLAPLTADQVYRLWAVADQEPLFCGQFNPSAEQATSQWTLPDAACGAEGVQMLITAEEASAPPVPAGTLVLLSQS